MRKSHVLLLTLLTTLGCGGDSGGVGSGPADAYVGRWSGSYGAAGQPVEGTLSVTIRRARASDRGVTVEGTALDVARGAATVQGHLPDAGLEGVSPVANLDLLFAPGNVKSLYGIASLDVRGHLIVTHLTNDNGIVVPQQDVDLAPVTP